MCVCVRVCVCVENLGKITYTGWYGQNATSHNFQIVAESFTFVRINLTKVFREGYAENTAWYCNWAFCSSPIFSGQLQCNYLLVYFQEKYLTNLLNDNQTFFLNSSIAPITCFF